MKSSDVPITFEGLNMHEKKENTFYEITNTLFP